MDDRAHKAVAVVHEFIGGGSNLGDALTHIAVLATEALGAAMAGLTLNTDAGRPKTVIYTDGMVPEIDQAQYDSDCGPCLEAFRTLEIELVPDMATEPRWPEFAEAAARAGITTTLSVPVIVGGRGVGALNFYDPERGRFEGEAAEVATLYARHAAIIAAYYDRAGGADNLQRAMESRAEIEQAKGIIMATSGGSA